MTSTHSKARASRMTAKEKKAAVASANRRAQLQWYGVGGVVAAGVIGAVVLISLLTEGELPAYGHG